MGVCEGPEALVVVAGGGMSTPPRMAFSMGAFAGLHDDRRAWA
jgi:hypothetical protein